MELVRTHHRLIQSGRLQPNLVGSTVQRFSAPVPRFRTNLSLKPLRVDRLGRSGSAGWVVLTRGVVLEGVSVGGGGGLGGEIGLAGRLADRPGEVPPGLSLE